MPRKEIDYSKTVIYKIVCNDVSVKDLYVGNTTDFTKRKGSHKSSCNNVNAKHYLLKVYKMIRENDGWDNFTMVLIENYPCENGDEARARERHWYDTLHATMNSNQPQRTKEDQVNYNMSDTRKTYRATHKEEISEYQKQYYLINKDTKLQQQAKYQSDNKVKIKAHKNEKNDCECGGKYTTANKTKHLLSAKHIKYLAK